MQTRSIELLAPAGDIDSFYSAVNNGANAVYLGLSGFNARLKADNFDGENLIKCVKYAHFFGVKVYVAVNTLVKNSEIADLIALVETAVDAHVDAFIVQDLGVAKILTECFPHIVLHASTQCGIHNADGAKIAEKLGFKRIVLSRETKLDDIKAIKATTDLELEFFVQGALCVSFSGNCYMSAVEASASGNRGLCKQLCRMQYDAVKETKDSQKLLKSGYLLSARDLCLIDSLKELLDAGISSFKIEGRMKRAGYVGEVVKIYRDAVDEIENQATKELEKQAYETENKNSKTETQAGEKEKKKEKINNEIDCKMPQKQGDIKPYSTRHSGNMEALKVAFSRGEFLSRAYLDQGVPFVVNSANGNHIGVEVGEVLTAKPFKDLTEITLSSRHILRNGDGLKFFEDGKEVGSLGVYNAKSLGQNRYSIITKTKVKAGAKARLILDSLAEDEAKSKTRLLPISLHLIAKVGEPMQLRAECQMPFGEISIGVLGDVAEGAKTAPLTVEQLKAQMSKTSDSGFEVEKIIVETDGVFAAKSQLNALRREALQALSDGVINAFERYNNTEKNPATINDIKSGVLQINDVNTDNIATSSADCVATALANCAETASTNCTETVLTNCVATASANCTETASANCDSTTRNKLKLKFIKSEDIYNSNIILADEVVALCPENYTEKCVLDMMSTLDITNKSRLALLLPNIATGNDIVVLDKLIEGISNKIEYLICENLYALRYAEKGFILIAGQGLNVANSATVAVLSALKIKAIIPSIEVCRDDINQNDIAKACLKNDIEVISVSSYFPLMTLAHCPFKTLFGNDCSKCSYQKDVVLKRENKTYAVRRIKVANCYFSLTEKA